MWTIALNMSCTATRSYVASWPALLVSCALTVRLRLLRRRSPASTWLTEDESEDQINETYACENDRTLNQILKGELGFRGCEVLHLTIGLAC